ncbi:MAG: molybdopterin-dependent oxidoreductase [Rhodobacterales bacterium]|nr:molybdopterin-dependent oxidoreductase [Rhodobacterales bacterium]
MSKLKTITRRTFLISSAAIAGGVAFGVYQDRKTPPNPLTAPTGGAALNPFVLIDQNGVTLIAPRAEMGQGIRTTLAALVAEELDVAWDDITVLHGPAAQAYYNGAAIAAGLPFKDYSITEFQHGMGQNLDFVAKMVSLQITGGSTSIRDGYEKMRHAGASAREALKQVAAERLGVDRATLSTENSHVIATDGTKIPYGDLAVAAAKIKAPQTGLRDAATWKYLGKSMPRVDMVAKSTGTARFGIDTRVDGMKFAALRINPRLGGKMIGFNATEAEKMTGVDRVIDLGNGVAVVGSNTWLAQQAVDAIDITWGDAPYPADMAGILAKVNSALDDSPNSTLRNEGDADDLPAGTTEIRADYTVPYLAHSTMEPMNATAHFTGDRLEIWCGNQAPVLTRDKCAEIAGLGPSAVSVHTTFMGGGFGRRVEIDYSIYATKVAVAMQGTPVQLTWSRQEDMRHDFYRPAAAARFRGAVKDGRAVLMDGKIAAQSTTREVPARLMGLPAAGPDKGHVEGAYDQPYAIPNYRITGHLAEVGVPIGFWRAVGNSFNGFFHETFIDELAHAAARDPLEFRLEMMRDEHAPSATTLETVRDMSDWTGKTPDGIGRGVAFTYSFGTPVAQVIEVQQTDDGIAITRAWIACDVGVILDPSIIEAQMFGGMIYGLSAAVHGEITFADCAVEQSNFPDYDALRMHNAPAVEVQILASNAHIGGVGEPGTPPAMPALGNALFDLTGKRARSLPLMHDFDLLT